MRALVLALVALMACTVSAPTPSPAVGPGLGGLAPTTWAFAGTLALPVDPSVYANVLRDAKPLADGGWVIVSSPTQLRLLCDPTSYGCFIPRTPGLLKRLDASGRLVAQEHGPEPFGLEHISVFENLGIVVGDGFNAVRNGNLHVFQLVTLDGLRTDVGTCVAVNGSCFSYRIDYQAGQTTLEQRDPTDLQVARAFTPLRGTPSAIFPSVNLVASRVGASLDVRALDTTRPIGVSWVTRLQTACSMTRVGDDRSFVMYGPPTCAGDTGWHGELVEVSTGRIIRAFAPSQSISGNTRDYIVLADTGITVDPRDGSDGPTFAGGDPLTVDWTRGIAAAPLSDGGAYVLQRRSGTPTPHDLSFSTIGSASCAEYEFARVMLATSATVKCAGAAQLVGDGRLLIATGRSAYGPTAFEITHVIADPVGRTLDIVYRAAGKRTTIADPSPTKIIELTDAPSGEWLVRLAGEGADLYNAKAFVVRFP